MDISTEMRTIEEIRAEKGFSSARTFAKHIGVSPAYYSQIVNGFRPITEVTIEKLQRAFPLDNFDDIVAKSHVSFKTNNITRYDSFTRIGMKRPPFKNVPIIGINDRFNITKLETTMFAGLQTVPISELLLTDQRANYMILIAGYEPYVDDSINQGDQLLAHSIPKEAWKGVIGIALIILAQETHIMNIENNGMWNVEDNVIKVTNPLYRPEEQSTHSLKIKQSEIINIYPIESIIYRKL